MHDKNTVIETGIVEKADMLLPTMCRLFSHIYNDKEKFLSHVLYGDVCINNDLVKNHLQRVKKGDVIKISLTEQSSASRGVYKLQPVLDLLGDEVKGKVYADVGCASGGFTDALLKYEAKAVHAIDVAYNTLAYKLRADKRVYVHERTNIFDIKELSPACDRAVVDVSFRSLQGLIAHVFSLCKDKHVIALCKPQFEFEKFYSAVKKNVIQTKVSHSTLETFSGAITDVVLQKEILLYTVNSLSQENVFTHSIYRAGLRGHKAGNLEFFLELRDRPAKGKLNFDNYNIN